MSYQSITKGQFCSKFLTADALYDITATDNCIRVAPYYGSENFGYLRWCNSGYVNHLSLPTALLKRAKIGNKIFVVEIAGVFYLLHKDFSGDPLALQFDKYQQFPIRPEATGMFYKEAELIDVSQMHRLPVKGNGVLLKDFKSILKFKTDELLQYSIHDHMGRRWVEVRKQPVGMKAVIENDRLPLQDFAEQLSGISVTTRYNGKFNIALPCFDDWDINNLYAWYSEVRESIIIEKAPDTCAVCGGLIRSISAEHFTANACKCCIPHLGKDNAYDVIFAAKKALKQLPA